MKRLLGVWLARGIAMSVAGLARLASSRHVSPQPAWAPLCVSEHASLGGNVGPGTASGSH